MKPDEILFETEAAMEKGVEYMIHEFAAVRTGKASPALVENIDVDAYGTSMKLKQLALISTPEPRLLLIQPFDSSVTKDIERALKDRDYSGSRRQVDPIADPGTFGGTEEGFSQEGASHGRRSASPRQRQSPDRD
jgi:ribosome recycling factor